MNSGNAKSEVQQGPIGDASIDVLYFPDGRSLSKMFKRLFDVVFSSAALISFASLMIIIFLLLKVSSKGSAFFIHHRVGVNGELFPCLKFRTMHADSDIRLSQLLEKHPEVAEEYFRTRKIRNDPRIIPGIGTFLRRTSLDELPQFFNVIAGHMSIVGPRPVTLAEWQEHYGMHHPYTSMRPGITGKWQVSGRNDVSYQERVDLDASYIENWSFLDDFAIIMQTFRVVCVDRNGH
ncbi:sugar transferase [Poseidonocella sp. HB161398]|uniref:sugar transferase n=1 Tax=Poseidonocella sp. HB161398 TaxID=2320855 RepID=UPI001F0E8DC0|nr:sugar transferase [Poseidonocella sp. HB161398]